VLLGLTALKILVEFDDYIARTYLKLFVKATEDGYLILRHPKYTIKNTVEVTKNPEFFEYWELNIEDLQSVSYLCLAMCLMMFVS